MTKATYERKHLISEGEPMIIVAGRKLTGVVLVL